MSAELLNIAYISEKSGEKLYENLSSCDENFSQILSIRKNGLTLLQNYAEILNTRLDETALAQALQMQNLSSTNEFEAIIFALNFEISLNKTYESLCSACENERLKDLFFRLWATSNNEYIVALKTKLTEILIQKPNQKSEQKEQAFGGKILENYQENFNAMSEQIKEIMGGKADKEQLFKLLNNPNFSLFSGLAIGALATQIISKNLKETSDENNSK